MFQVLVATHMLLAIALIGLILIQRGKGADIGAAFGSGASQTVFGSQGSASFLTRATAVLATLFFVATLGLSYAYTQVTERESVTDEIVMPAAPSAMEEMDQMGENQGGPADIPAVPQATEEQNPTAVSPDKENPDKGRME